MNDLCQIKVNLESFWRLAVLALFCRSLISNLDNRIGKVIIIYLNGHNYENKTFFLTLNSINYSSKYCLTTEQHIIVMKQEN